MTDTVIIDSSERTKSDNRKLLWAMIISEIAMWTLYGNIATFYPPYKN